MTDTLLVDTHGRLRIDPDYFDEPNPGSIALVKGPNGTAWQRFARDGLWHPVNSRLAFTWNEFLDMCVEERNVRIVYEAPPLPESAHARRLGVQVPTVHTWATGRGN